MENNKKAILFLSALDFKEKSIQVIRKTPEAYVRSGWKVHYVVARDNSKYGNYYYEKEINPEGVNVYRFYYSFTKLRDFTKSRILKVFFAKIDALVSIFKLANCGSKVIRKNKIDVIYGYEVHGVLAVNILKIFKRIKKAKIVSRFQGTFYTDYHRSKMYYKMLLHFDNLLALYLPSDLCIMTNDGTRGDEALKLIKSKNLKNYRFWINGVDELKLTKEEVRKLRNQMNLNKKIVFLTVSRLISWKRVERSINVINILKNKYNFSNFVFFIVGDGDQRPYLEKLAKSFQLEKNIIFTGAVVYSDVKLYYNIADIFISTYDSSNVGNPLLEAIRTNKIIFTLNNGDTNKWITHYRNGFIYDIDENLYENMAYDIYKVINDESLRNSILENIKKTEKERLWTWEERLNAEIKEVENLLNEN